MDKDENPKLKNGVPSSSFGLKFPKLLPVLLQEAHSVRV